VHVDPERAIAKRGERAGRQGAVGRGGLTAWEGGHAYSVARALQDSARKTAVAVLASPLPGRRLPVTRSCKLPVTGAALAAVAVALALVVPALSGAQSEGDLRSRADRARARERGLAGEVARLGALVAKLDRDITVIERRRAEVQAQLDADRVKLAALRQELRAERRRVVRLRARLREARRILSARLVELYQTQPPDLVTVIMRAHGFADLLEQSTYVKAVGRQDQRIIHLVRRARVDAAQAVRRLARDEARQEDITAGIESRRDALVGIGVSLQQRRTVVAQARAARAALLVATRANRQRLEQRIAALVAARAQAAAAVGPGGPWAIPWPIVQCESGGQNLPPNYAGASGYYQILPSTWRLFGGAGPAAWKASKAEQDRVASVIWAGGSGAHNWVCAALVS
jgi:peptidoglycan hydrolase CwlO-like protein